MLEDTVKCLGTNTHHATDGSMKEVIIVGVDSHLVGQDRDSPPNPYEYDFSQDLRCSYLILEDRIFTQFPRWSNEYHQIEERKELIDIVFDSRENTLSAYYMSETGGLLVTWDVNSDEWERKTIAEEEYTDQLENSETTVVWSKNRSRNLQTTNV